MPKRILEGKVVSTKQDKTATVLVERRYMHPMYKKYVRRTDKYAAHDEHNAAVEGQVVQIQECRPISKRKTWTLLQGAAEVKAKTAAAPKKAAANKETKEKKKA